VELREVPPRRDQKVDDISKGNNLKKTMAILSALVNHATKQ
jgi:hypothetical protein